MLLVVAKETNDTDEIRLTYQQFEDWYGIGRRTAVKGMRELVGHGLVQVRQESVKAALSGTGRTVHQHFSLTGAFSYQSRNARQNKAAMEAAGRAAATKPAKVSAPAKSIKKPRKRKASDE